MDEERSVNEFKADQVRDEVCGIISQVAGLPPRELEDDHLIREELMLDSLKELEIVARMEIRFGINLDEDRLLSLRTLGELCSLVREALTG